MSIFTRLSATLVAGVDRTVSRIEDHDAIIDASLRESRRAQAQAKIRMKHVQRDGDVLRQRQNELTKFAENWAERARKTHDEDRALALDCVRRRQSTLKELDRVNDSLAQHAELESQVRQTIDQIGRQLQDVTQQRNQMRSRESAAEAQRIISQLDGIGGNGLEDTFDRWEMKISETEIVSTSSLSTLSSSTETDSLDAEFRVAEDNAEMELALDALLEVPNTQKGSE